MTDNEIIKALECCNRPANQTSCDDCPYRFIHEKCSSKLINDALDLINRQKAEIAVHERHLYEWDDKLTRIIEELPLKFNSLRAEAIKEFAERLKKEFLQHQREYRKVLNSDGACAMIIAKKSIDNLVKEMTEASQ